MQKKSVPCTLKTMITKHTLKVNAEINVFLHFLHFHEEIISFKNAPAFLLRGARHSIACGMNGHYAKPIDFEALQRNIGSFLNVQKK